MKLFNKYIFSVFVFVVSFIIYILTAAPGLMFTDCGELASVCTTLGIAHPTGYPLFSILGYLWTKLPLPLSNIQSLNIFAGFLTAMSVLVFFHTSFLVLTYLSNKHKSKSQTPDKKKKSKSSKFSILWSRQIDDSSIILLSTALSLTYAFARTIWQQATSIEVYSLQLLLMNLIILFLLKAVLENNQKYYLLSAFLLGLGFANHLTTVLMLPAILYLFFNRTDEKFNFSAERWKIFAILLIPLFIGLSFYIYLPMRAATLPEFNWGWVSRNWDKFIYHVSGKQYQVWMFADMSLWKTNLVRFAEEVPFQLGFVGILFMLYGFYILLKTSKELFWFFIFLIVFCLAYTLNYQIHDIDTYFSTAFFALLLVSGVGLLTLAKRSFRLIPAFFVLPVIALAFNYTTNDESDNVIVPEYTKILTNNLEPNALIISAQWDYYCSAFWYMQKVEGYRKDIVLIEKELMRRTWYPKQFSLWYPEIAKKSEKEMNLYLEDLELFESEQPYSRERIQQRFVNMFNSFIDQNYGKKPIYLTIDIITTDPDIGKDYEKVPQGFAFRLMKGDSIFPASFNSNKLTRFMKSLDHSEGHLVDGIRNTVAINIANIGRYALYTKRPEEAEKAFRLALSIEPTNEVALDGMRRLGR
ncbi:MAG: hypothetical protein A2X61_00535 [Ignavibacteria bacterium GWB2_35_12]|nr:MAG: hypothetical protein A2X63_09790 [Ignavibacteria bacterium GWA2_35_8]OGU42604.1 MAG: hypothetical protein A2X61_00535 [Ignavibacteria bacterium GWB2_35_12]OGU96431.1 MAG: hypothetical protein A2220_07705 [Ignavibacteria bacterium RIFOXYA2_FULL_35_10]OGV18594.1 MAG: hypothetical protein A2475_07555 [Ignavibacteria bacterium RIFOXYC2_FULL_35_21]